MVEATGRDGIDAEGLASLASPMHAVLSRVRPVASSGPRAPLLRAAVDGFLASVRAGVTAAAEVRAEPAVARAARDGISAVVSGYRSAGAVPAGALSAVQGMEVAGASSRASAFAGAAAARAARRIEAVRERLDGLGRYVVGARVAPQGSAPRLHPRLVRAVLLASLAGAATFALHGAAEAGASRVRVASSGSVASADEIWASTFGEPPPKAYGSGAPGVAARPAFVPPPAPAAAAATAYTGPALSTRPAAPYVPTGAPPVLRTAPVPAVAAPVSAPTPSAAPPAPPAGAQRAFTEPSQGFLRLAGGFLSTRGGLGAQGADTLTGMVGDARACARAIAPGFECRLERDGVVIDMGRGRFEIRDGGRTLAVETDEGLRFLDQPTLDRLLKETGPAPSPTAGAANLREPSDAFLQMARTYLEGVRANGPWAKGVVENLVRDARAKALRPDCADATVRTYGISLDMRTGRSSISTGWETDKPVQVMVTENPGQGIRITDPNNFADMFEHAVAGHTEKRTREFIEAMRATLAPEATHEVGGPSR